MEEPGLSGNGTVTILEVLEVHICQREILDQVPIIDIFRSERVSRRWQHMVLMYLQNCRNLTLEVYEYGNVKKYGQRSSVTIYTGDDLPIPLPIFSKTLEKLGSFIVRLIITNMTEEFYESIASNCPYLRHAELDYFSPEDISEKSIRDLIRNKDLKTIKLTGLKKFSGNRKNSVTWAGLSNPSMVYCQSSQLGYCFNQDWRVRNVTNLHFEGTRNQPNNLNLKRLNIWSCHGVNSSQLKGLAGYSKLEYLNISGCSLSDCRRGLEALIRRPSVTWLCLGFIKNMPYEKLKQLRVITELERCGCNYVTPEMLKEASLASRGQKHALEFKMNNPAKKECSELKIILDRSFECRKSWSDNED